MQLLQQPNLESLFQQRRGDIQDLDVQDLDVQDLDVQDLDVQDLDVQDLDVQDLDVQDLDDQAGREEIILVVAMVQAS